MKMEMKRKIAKLKKLTSKVYDQTVFRNHLLGHRSIEILKIRIRKWLFNRLKMFITSSRYEKPMHNPDYTSSDEEMDANPSKHVPLDDKSNMMRIPWMHGRMDRTIAENLLRGPEVGQGAFLMRESQSHKGDFTLTIKNGSRIAHCRIVRNYRGLFALKVCADRDFVDSDGNRGGPWFADIETLVAEYSLNPIPTLRTREGRGLVLRNPLLREAGSSRENISPNNKENNPNFKIGFDYRTSEDSKKANPAKDAYSNMTEIQADEANKSQDDFSVDELYE
eukprot:m.54971 g.54971  ORF g.54971 m.54971 type:complete len:279 (-) comp10961_c0_seq5:70-906(-)